MKICPRCHEWRTKAQMKPMAGACKACLKELDDMAKKGNRDVPNKHIRQFGQP